MVGELNFMVPPQAGRHAAPFAMESTQAMVTQAGLA